MDHVSKIHAPIPGFQPTPVNNVFNENEGIYPLNLNENNETPAKSDTSTPIGPVIATSKAVDKVADLLVKTFRSPESRAFYCLVALKLRGYEIETLMDIALKKGNSPGALFNHLATRRMNELK